MRILLLLTLVSLSSCATKKVFKAEVNCSPRALNKFNNNTASKTVSKEQAALVNASITSETKKCFQSHLDNSNVDEFVVCNVIETDNKGKIIFLDIEDYANPLPKELHSCLINSIGNGKFESMPSSIVIIPINLTPRRL